eukprot:4342135-Prymnesium_polylepis.1
MLPRCPITLHGEYVFHVFHMPSENYVFVIHWDPSREEPQRHTSSARADGARTRQTRVQLFQRFRTSP